MIVFSRSRTETKIEAAIARTLASTFHARVLSIPFLYDLRFSSRTLQRLRTMEEPGVLLAPFPERVSKNLLDFLEIKNMVAVMDTTQVDAEQMIQFVERVSVPENIPGGLFERLDEPTVSRWYPVIDQQECVSCLECVNFCLFGVYVIGKNDHPIVDQPDACRNGCPACARVCPRAAILFPMHEEADISGRNDAEIVRQKIDPAQAEKERQKHRQPDELDDLVEQVDRLMF